MSPFTHRSMIKDPDCFYGRRMELRRIFDLLRNGCVSILGNRRIGKSSVLAQICHPTVHGRYLEDAGEFLFIFLDLQELAELDQPSFFQAIINKCSEASRGAIAQTASGSVDRSDFRRFIRGNFKTVGRRRLVCCFDEFEHMSDNRHFDDEFFTFLRSLSNQYNLGYVISSRTGLQELCHRNNLAGSQFWNIFAVEALGLMSAAETRELITEPFRREGMALSEQEIATVLALAGAFPFFIQIACFNLFDAKRHKAVLTPVDIQALDDLFYNEVAFHFRFMVDNEQPEARELLRRICLGEAPAATEPNLRHLINRSLVLTEAGHTNPFSQAFGDYVLKATATQTPKPPPTATGGKSKGSFCGSTAAEVLWSKPPPRLSICLGEDHAVMELAGATRYFTMARLKERLTEKLIEDWRRVAMEIYEDGTHWQRRMRREGANLFKQLFLDNPPLARAFASGLGMTRDRPLEIIFRTPREMLSLPLELMRAEEMASGEEGPLPLLHPMARYITDMYFHRLPLEGGNMKPSALKVLLLAGAGYEDLALDRELDAVQKILVEGGVHQVTRMDSRHLSMSQVEEALDRCTYDVIHYAGHGFFDKENPERSGLVFNDVRGKQWVLACSQMQGLLEYSTVRLFFMNACQGASRGDLFQGLDREFLGILDALIVAKIPTILTARWPISDKGAILLAEVFYLQLLRTRSPVQALWLARRTLARRHPNDPDWAAPLLVIQGA